MVVVKAYDFTLWLRWSWVIDRDAPQCGHGHCSYERSGGGSRPPCCSGQVQQGIEIVIEQDHRPVAFIRPSQHSGRTITEILREARLRGSKVTLDEDFSKDLQGVIALHQKLWDPPSWD